VIEKKILRPREEFIPESYNKIQDDIAFHGMVMGVCNDMEDSELMYWTFHVTGSAKLMDNGVRRAQQGTIHEFHAEEYGG
jgi:hypothetical protein